MTNGTPSNGDRQGPSLLEAAIDYCRRGWSIIPIAAGTKKPPKGFRWSKYQKRRPTEVELRDWFADRDDLGLAVIFGAVSEGLVCRDFDTKEAYQRWAADHPELAKTLPTVATARGYGVYFRTVPANLFFVDLRELHPPEDGEYRGDSGHYCLLPPSRHPKGPLYDWLVGLPAGDVPFIEDVVAAGLVLVTDETQKAQGRRRKSQVVVEGVEGASVVLSASVADRAPIRRLSPSVRQVIDEAMARTLPTKAGERRNKLFELARRLKFAPEFAGTPATMIDFLKPYLLQWWNRAMPRTSGKHPEFWHSWQDFVFAWEEARIPFGATMQSILEKARSAPPPAMAVEKYGEGSLKALLASLCRELQQHSGQKPFPLTGRTAGPLIGVSDVQAWRWLKRLVTDRIIEPVKTHPRGTRLGTEYRYLLGD
jgi:hypothetical protein